MKRISLPTFLLMLYAAFIVYATTIPFNVVRSKAQLSHNLSVISWTPFYNTDEREFFSKNDLITNVLFFIPFGVFGGYSLQKKRLNRGKTVLVLWALGVCLSALVESLQLFTVDRNTSTTDLITNGLGALIGAIISFMVKSSTLATGYRRHAASKANAPSLFSFLGILALTFVALSAPFDFTLSRHRIVIELEALATGFSAARIDWGSALIAGYFSTLLTFSCAQVARQWKVAPAPLWSALFSCLYGAGLITFQMFIFSRHLDCGTVVGWIGGFAAAMMARAITRGKESSALDAPLLAALALGLLWATLAGPIARAGSFGDFMAENTTQQDGLTSLTNFLEITSLYIPIGFLFWKQGASGKKVFRILTTVCAVPLCAPVMYFGLSHGVSVKHAAGTLVLAESGVFMGAAARIWGARIFHYYVRWLGASSASSNASGAIKESTF